MTLVDGVFSLPPGHRLSVSGVADVKRVEPVAYWTFGDAAIQRPRRDADDVLENAAAKLRPILTEAGGRHT